MTVNLPNQITLVRLALAIVFFVLLAQVNIRLADRQVVLLDVCIVMFVLAAATDWLDGHLARRRNEVTDLGRVLDPFVDKVLVCGTFVFLCGPGFCDEQGRPATALYPWMVVLILGRELLVTGLRGFSGLGGSPFGANVYGKAKMVIQSVTAPTLLAFVAHFDRMKGAASFAWIKSALVWLTVVFTTLSMVSYLFQSRRILTQPPK